VPNVDTTQPAGSRRRESSMPPVLKQLIGRQPDARALVAAIADALGSSITVEDADGRVLYGDGLAGPDNVRVPVTHQEARVGWVAGPPHARTIAALLDHLVARDAEKKALGAEVLHLYREINLIYSFSEKLAALLELERVARLTLDEARHVIVATDGVLLLLDEDADTLTAVAGFGDELPTLDGLRRGHGIVGAVAASGVGEVVNDVALDARRAREHTKVRGLICAPLKVGERTIGVLALGSTDPMPYTAAELKLLTTLALQTATAIVHKHFVTIGEPPLTGSAAAEVSEAAAMLHPSSAVAPYVTVSVGVSAMLPDVASAPETLFDAADRALYVAKARGRNCVVSRHDDLPDVA